jgi:hypothetical protein
MKPLSPPTDYKIPEASAVVLHRFFMAAKERLLAPPPCSPFYLGSAVMRLTGASLGKVPQRYAADWTGVDMTPLRRAFGLPEREPKRTPIRDHLSQTYMDLPGYTALTEACNAHGIRHWFRLSDAIFRDPPELWFAHPTSEGHLRFIHHNRHHGDMAYLRRRLEEEDREAEVTRIAADFSPPDAQERTWMASASNSSAPSPTR